MQMKSILLAAAAAFALSGGAALAQSGGNGGGNGSSGGNPAVGNSTTTSMGAPSGSPSYQAPRSHVVPGLSAQQRTAQAANKSTEGQTNQGVTAPVQGPKTLNGNTQTAQ